MDQKMTFVPVLGMHRSGTSCVAGVLRELGVYFGEDTELLNANTLNPKGYNELYIGVRANDSILESVHSSWKRPPQLAVAADWRKKFHAKRNHGKYLMQMSYRYLHYGAQIHGHKAFGIKDPRMLLTLPFWIHHVPKNVEVKGIVVTRDSQAILKSWVAAHRLNVTTAKRAQGLYMQWLKNNLQRTKIPYKAISYEKLLGDPNKYITEIMDYVFGNSNSQIVMSASSYVDPKLNSPGTKKAPPPKKKDPTKKKKKPTPKKTKKKSKKIN